MNSPLMATIAEFVLSNFAPLLFVAALLIVAFDRGKPLADRTLSWLLLLPIGLGGLWSAFFHLAFPEVAARAIGWMDSPFQFEVGMADLGIGVAGCLAFRASWGFRAAVVVISAIFFFGDSIGHLRQMIVARNFAIDNAGPVFWLDVALPVLSLIALLLSRRARK
ncbi:hypothetical protein Msil_2438 [Methylocella silvestris BL2]|uniref:Uncharacterized protein n=1 Tax=Methylocella silvestris (strain DSM 15510 / CIP 108128 / LMG 27833 / NCIMB 13906 / BL2) TaxID=395965 RepID=B8EKJ7_METSB|nr:DUF6790 family protein [Methylocella silvestris]ACK51367.1 hypothetical protein Msil_2438 [Methylocella silvestris BL2]